MSEKEHPARTAGKYVRAAGVALKKERARLAAESAAKRAAEEAQAQAVAQAAPQAQAPAQPAAPPPAASTPTAAPAKPKRAPAPAPPPNRFLDRLCWVTFVVMCIATCLILLTVDTFFSGTPKTVVRLVLGTMFVVSAVGIFTNALHAKDRVLTTMTRKLWGLEHSTSRTGRFMRGIAKDVLTLLGIGWLAIGVYLLLRIVAD